MVKSDNIAQIFFPSFLQLKYYVAPYYTATVSNILLLHNLEEKKRPDNYFVCETWT